MAFFFYVCFAFLLRFFFFLYIIVFQSVSLPCFCISLSIVFFVFTPLHLLLCFYLLSLWFPVITFMHRVLFIYRYLFKLLIFFYCTFQSVGPTYLLFMSVSAHKSFPVTKKDRLFLWASLSGMSARLTTTGPAFSRVIAAGKHLYLSSKFSTFLSCFTRNPWSKARKKDASFESLFGIF